MSRKHISATLILAVITIQGCTVTASPEVKQTTQTATAQASKTPFLSQDGKTQILLPPGWSNARKSTTSDNLSIKVANRAKDWHLNVTTQPNLAGVPLTNIAEVTISTMQKAMQNSTMEQTAVKQVNGYKAVQYKLQGLFSGTDVTMILTGIETPKHFHFITATSSTNTFEQYQPELKQMIDSFKEVKTQASSQ